MDDDTNIELQRINSDLTTISDSMHFFLKEKEALKKINAVITDILKTKVSEIDLAKINNEIWKFYRAYKLKEFIYLFHERISAEKETVTKSQNLTIHMIEELLWKIPEYHNGDGDKYSQRFHSEKIKNAKITVKRPDEDKIKLKLEKINKKYQDEIIEKVEGITLSKKTKDANKKDRIFNIKKNLNLDKLYEECKVKQFNQIVNNFADVTGSNIRLEHVYPREQIKLKVIKLCSKLKSNTEYNIKEIDECIDAFLPFSFAILVSKGENDKLCSKSKKNNDEAAILEEAKNEENYISQNPEDLITALFEPYKKSKIKVFDTHNNYNEIDLENLKQEKLLKTFCVDYKTLNICDKEITWENGEWE